MIIAERPEYIKNNPRDICHQRKKRGRKKGDVLNILKNEKTGTVLVFTFSFFFC